ncbi:MAG TPA: energy transducer TonB, partial [Vicinamibacterales bacterium]|nr:energy transducer TonB [Vicinamibacterales bacterium]
MPQELLRDVLRTGDAPDRARRRLSILPISIAAHAVAVAALVIMPLAASVELPPIASPFDVGPYVRTVQPPSPPPPSNPDPARRPAPGAPLIAPDHIAPEEPPTPGPPEIGLVGPPDVGSVRGLSDVGGVADVVLPPPPPPPPTQVKPVRVGPGIREPKKIVHVIPEYPEIARRARVEGVVILEAVLDASGRVQSVRVLRSTPLLDDAAIKAVQQWRYTPTELNGVPVPVLMTITVQFTLA